MTTGANDRALAHEMIDRADTKLLGLIIALANEYEWNDSYPYKLSPEDEAELDADEAAIERGEMKMLTEEEFWASVKKPEGRNV